MKKINSKGVHSPYLTKKIIDMKKIEESYTSARFTIETENDFDYKISFNNRASNDGKYRKPDVHIELTVNELLDLVTTLQKGADEDIITSIGKKISFIDKLCGKQKTIDKINAIIKEYGSFGTYDVVADSSPILNSIGDIVALADTFNVDTAEVEITDTNNDVTLAEITVNYSDFNQEALEEILELAEQYKEQQIEENKE